MNFKKSLPDGIYDLLHTNELHERLESQGHLNSVIWSSFDKSDLQHRLIKPLAREIASFISEKLVEKKGSEFESTLIEAFQSESFLREILESVRPKAAETLQQIKLYSR